MPGCLSEFSVNNRSSGFLAFIRLIGTAYFKKHISSFISVYNMHTPHHLYNSIDSTHTDSMEKHKLFVEKIRSVNSERISTEEERMPSHSAFFRHWKRVSYICMMWQNAHLSDIYHNLPTPESSGWIINEDGTHSIDWDDANTQRHITESINRLLRGCNCKKGCSTNRCGCVSKSQHCGPGCNCYGCTNLPTQFKSPEDTCSNISSEESDDSSSSFDHDSEIETEIITDEFMNVDIF
jgi:hypothetical protein